MSDLWSQTDSPKWLAVTSVKTKKVAGDTRSDDMNELP